MGATRNGPRISPAKQERIRKLAKTLGSAKVPIAPATRRTSDKANKRGE